MQKPRGGCTQRLGSGCPSVSLLCLVPLRRGLSPTLNPELVFPARMAAEGSQLCSCLLAHQLWGWRSQQPHLNFYMGASSCLCSKHFTHWAISPAQRPPYNVKQWVTQTLQQLCWKCYEHARTVRQIHIVGPFVRTLKYMQATREKLEDLQLESGGAHL